MDEKNTADEVRIRKKESSEGVAKKEAQEVGPASVAHGTDDAVVLAAKSKSCPEVCESVDEPLPAGRWVVDEDESSLHGGGGLVDNKLSPTSITSLVSTETQPGAVAIPGPGAIEYGETRLSRYVTTTGSDPALATSESDDSTFSNVEAAVTATAFLAEEPEIAAIIVEERTSDLPAGEREKEEEEFCCSLDVPCGKVRVLTCAVCLTRRRLAVAALLGILVAGVLGIMAGTGVLGPHHPPPIHTDVVCGLQKLVADDPAKCKNFGNSMSLDARSNTLVIGAKTVNNETKVGYVFTRPTDSGPWRQEAMLVPDEPVPLGFPETSVSVDGNTAIVGQSGDGVNGIRSGSAFVFTRSRTGWRQQSKLLPRFGADEDFFGKSVAIDKDTVLVGAPHMHPRPQVLNSSHSDSVIDENNPHSGSAYVFTRAGSVWVQQAKLLPIDRRPYDWFGYAVALDGDTALVSRPKDDENANDNGAAYVFTRNGTRWAQEGKVLMNDATNDDRNDHFGISVALDKDTAIVGNKFHDENGDRSGAAYIFTRTGTKWTQQAELFPSDPEENDTFGNSVAVDGGDTAVVGAWKDDDKGEQSGSAYVFRRGASDWKQVGKLVPDDLMAGYYFGASLTMDGGTVVVGASSADVDGSTKRGSAYSFELDLC